MSEQAFTAHCLMYSESLWRIFLLVIATVKQEIYAKLT